jgi:hypothetical protein
MEPRDPDSPVVYRDLERYATKEDLRDAFVEFEQRITRSVATEIARIANVIDEHHRREIGVVHDKVQSVEDALHAHEADMSVHQHAS